MNFEIKYHPEVQKVDLPKIDIKNKAMIKKAIEERLMTRPEIYGKPLHRKDYLLQVRVLQQMGAGPGEGDAAFFQDVGLLGHI